jgi:two-component system, response regulator PdtaR
MTPMTAAHALTVLTVEDDPIVRADLRLVLEDAGFTVCADARDGEEAVELAREHTPDVILMDLGLPRISGVEATRRILAHRDVPIVALTGHRDAQADAAIEAGAVSLVTKPFVVRDVVTSLRDAAAQAPASEVRTESREALRHLVELLGHPAEWGDELEEAAFARGVAWKLTRRDVSVD